MSAQRLGRGDARVRRSRVLGQCCVARIDLGQGFVGLRDRVVAPDIVDGYFGADLGATPPLGKIDLLALICGDDRLGLLLLARSFFDGRSHTGLVRGAAGISRRGSSCAPDDKRRASSENGYEPCEHVIPPWG